MEKSQSEQMKMNNRISSKLKVEKKTAFSLGTNVERRLLTSVNQNVFIMLCSLLYNIGEERFNGSVALQMANSGHNGKQIFSIVRTTICTPNTRHKLFFA